MEEILKELVLLYCRISFARVNDSALTAERRAELIKRHRGMAFWLLLPGTLFMLPFLVLYVAAVVALGMEWESIWGDTTERQLALAMFGLFFVQFLLVGAAYVLCLVRKDCKGLGLVLALADLLHFSPRCLQNIWRVLAALPFLALFGMLCYVLIRDFIL